MLHGIDVSKWQGLIRWDEVAPHVDEVLIRSTMGASGVDPLYAANWQGCKAAGITRRSVYHLVTSNTPWRGQRDNLARVTGGDFGTIPVVLDVERTAADRASTVPFPRQQYTDDLLELGVWLLARAPGVNVYSNATEIRAMTTGIPALTLFGFHGAGYPSRAPMTFAKLEALQATYQLDVPLPWREAAAWQGASTGQLPGIAGYVDLSLVYATVGTPPVVAPPALVAEQLAASADIILGQVAAMRQALAGD